MPGVSFRFNEENKDQEAAVLVGCRSLDISTLVESLVGCGRDFCGGFSVDFFVGTSAADSVTVSVSLPSMSSSMPLMSSSSHSRSESSDTVILCVNQCVYLCARAQTRYFHETTIDNALKIEMKTVKID